MTTKNIEAKLRNRQKNNESIDETIGRLLRDTENPLTVEETLAELVKAYEHVTQIYAEPISSECNTVVFTIHSGHADGMQDPIETVEPRDQIEIGMPDGESKRVQFLADGTRSGPSTERRTGMIVYFDADDNDETVSLEEGAEKLRDSLKHIVTE